MKKILVLLIAGMMFSAASPALADESSSDGTPYSSINLDVQSYTAAAVTMTDTDTREVYSINCDNDVIDFTLIGAAEGLVRCFDAGEYAQIMSRVLVLLI